MFKLLSRDQFREKVFQRDNYKCVFCENPAKDAHHIIERRLWDDQGYYLENGASVCHEHHMACEMTLISVEDVRESCGITKKIIPSHFYDDCIYDKWGNIILSNGNRLKGELFYDESVQKILKKGNVLNLFVPYVKYQRTYHVPWSLGMHDDDRMLKNMQHYHGKRVIVSEKFDGENSSLYHDYIHARSIDSRNHPSRNWLKQYWSQFSMDIPKDWRICGENMYAEHSIHYYNLESYFYGFSIWNDKNVCLSWDETLYWFELLGIIPAPVLYDGIYDEKIIKSLWDESKWDTMEGYVIRLADSFDYMNFKNSVSKFVRKGHVQTVKHWMHGKPIIKNDLKK